MRLEYLTPLITAANAGTPGSTIFLHRLPLQASSATVLLNTLTPDPVDHELVGWERHRLTIVSRDKNPVLVENRNRQVIATLTVARLRLPAQPAFNLPAIQIYLSRMVRRPIVFPRTEGDLWECSCDMDFFLQYPS